jgi:hypothetical protein
MITGLRLFKDKEQCYGKGSVGSAFGWVGYQAIKKRALLFKKEASSFYFIMLHGI